MNVPVIAIDGPSGSGKGTLARLLAARLGWHLLDSGALYRLTALAALRRGVALDDAPALARVAAELDVHFESDGSREGRILLDGVEVGAELRTETTGNAASCVASVPQVREALFERQRRFAVAPGLVADGRDMGTVVFPDAALKVYLDASAQVRAERRYKQLKEKGIGANLADLVAEIRARDERDMNRSVAPLRPAEDALMLDSSTIGIDAVLDQVMVWMRERLGEARH
ncbi:MAG: (d)CMP kinase [Halothiobacillaceae bacterium]|jgi:cytidylate kinase|nr:(d)CMP kinase [Halothiobacillaceae bacterium]